MSIIIIIIINEIFNISYDSQRFLKFGLPQTHSRIFLIEVLF